MLINYTFRVNIILKGVVLAVEFKDIIKKLRLERDLSQQELAEKTGLSASSIGMYEQGRRKPSFEVLELFADTFNVDMDYLLGRSSEPNKYSRILTRAQDELSKEELQSLENMAEYFLSRKKK
nr:MAG TPA: repressor protein [Caudoviricetes sp.]